MFEIGCKVVCVPSNTPDEPAEWWAPCGDPVVGQIYVVDQIESTGLGVIGVPLLWRTDDGTWDEGVWSFDSFRRLEEIQAESRERQKQRQPA